jgi:hypothetical protein
MKYLPYVGDSCFKALKSFRDLHIIFSSLEYGCYLLLDKYQSDIQCLSIVGSACISSKELVNFNFPSGGNFDINHLRR